jgi:hypothetical protein
MTQFQNYLGVKMSFLNDRQYKELVHRQSLRKNPLICIEDFKDKSDRTLTVGYAGSSEEGWITHHSYIKNGLLHSYIYVSHEDGSYSNYSPVISGEYILAKDLSPAGPSYPSSTDYEFALIMENLHYPLEFYSKGSHGDNAVLITEVYYGEIPDLTDGV